MILLKIFEEMSILISTIICIKQFCKKILNFVNISKLKNGFCSKVLQQIEQSNNKVNGIMLLMNGTNQEVINNDNLLKSGFSPEDTCPNRYSDNSSCPSQPWNPYGTDILLKSWSFPIFVVYNQNAIKEIIDVRIINFLIKIIS